MRELAGRYARRHQAGEPVYVLGRAIPQWAFYTTRWSAPDTARLACFARAGSSGGPGFENAPSRRAGVAVDEGAELQCRSAEEVTLVGLPSGMEYQSGIG